MQLLYFTLGGGGGRSAVLGSEEGLRQEVGQDLLETQARLQLGWAQTQRLPAGRALSPWNKFRHVKPRRSRCRAGRDCPETSLCFFVTLVPLWPLCHFVSFHGVRKTSLPAQQQGGCA